MASKSFFELIQKMFLLFFFLVPSVDAAAAAELEANSQFPGYQDGTLQDGFANALWGGNFQPHFSDEFD